MRNTDCIFTWKNNESGKFEPCSTKTKYAGDVYQKSHKPNTRCMPMIDFEFCKEHYETGLKHPDYTFKNVREL